VVAADTAYGELRDVVRAPGAECAFAGRVRVPDARLRPFVAYWAGVPLERVVLDPPADAEIQALTSLAQQVSSRSLPSETRADPLAPPPLPAGSEALARAKSWQVAGRCARQ
jgi:hypothetical protein